MSSLDIWRSDFGDEYTERNKFGSDKAGWNRRWLRPMVSGVLPEITSVLEVGCNRGHNLNAWTPEAHTVVGVEPNAMAREIAQGKGFEVHDAHAGALPFSDGSFDLVFTAGVLIHIGPDHLSRSMYEIWRVSRRFVLAVEYQADREVAVAYRGYEQGIWKRNYAAEYMDRFPGLRLVGAGDEDALAGTPFDGCSWWLFDKRP